MPGEGRVLLVKRLLVNGGDSPSAPVLLKKSPHPWALTKPLSSPLGL